MYWLQQGEKLRAVKAYRDENGCDLMYAKYVIDELELQMREERRRKTPDAQPGDEVMQLIRRGEKLMAVKVYKKQTGCDLILAKNFIDELYEQYGPKPEQPKTSSFKEWSEQQAKPKTTDFTDNGPKQSRQSRQRTRINTQVSTPTPIGDHYDKGERQGCLGVLLIMIFLFLGLFL